MYAEDKKSTLKCFVSDIIKTGEEYAQHFLVYPIIDWINLDQLGNRTTPFKLY